MEQPTSPSAPLDAEISQVRAQIDHLRNRRSLLSSTLLSSRSTLARLQRAKGAAPSTNPRTNLTAAISLAEKQASHNLENLYRTCAGITAFRVQDPDPNAVDDGKVLGIRIEVFVNGTFLPPYFLLLHRPNPSSPALRIHKHTVPPCIPLQPLVAKHLPPPPALFPSGEPAKPPRTQDLPRLVRALRRELVAHHKRLAAVEKLRVEAGGVDDAAGTRAAAASGGAGGIEDIKAVHVSAREIEIMWQDGAVGRVRIGRDGVVEKAVVRAAEESEEAKVGRRIRDLERRIGGGDGRVDGVVGRLRGGEVG